MNSHDTAGPRDAGRSQAGVHRLRRALTRLGPRWPALSGLLALEYLTIGIRFDAQALAGHDVFGLQHLGTLMTVVLTMLVSAVFLRGFELVDDLADARAEVGVGATAAWVGAHCAAFVALYTLSGSVFVTEGPTPTPQLLFAWCAAAVATPCLLLPVLVRLRSIPTLLRKLWPHLALGLLGGLLAVGLGRASALLWNGLGHYTLDFTLLALEMLSQEVVYEPDELLLGTPRFLVKLAPECSGFEGMGLITTLLGGYIYVHRRELRFPNVLWVIPACVVLVWLANVGRIAVLILIGTHVSADVAVGGFHSRAGWLLFCVIAIGAIAEIHRSERLSLRDRSSEPAHLPPSRPQDSATAHLLPLMALIATTMLTGAFSAHVDMLYGARILAAVACLVWLRAAYREYAVRPDAVAVLTGVVVYAAWALWVAPHSEGGALLRARLDAMPGALALGWIAVRVLGSTLVVPVVEELAFRGYLLRRLQGRDFDAVPFTRPSAPALVLSSLAFGLVHGDFLAGTFAGLAFGWVQGRRGKLADAVTAHAVSNGLVAAQALSLGHWGLWG